MSERVREVLDSLAARPTRSPETGRFVDGGLAAGTTLERSTTFWTTVEPIKRDLVDRVRADLVSVDMAETMLGILDAYAEARLFRQAMFLRLVEQGGPITAKGKARALYGAYLGAMDRELKLAQTLGLERRQKRVGLEAYLSERYGSQAAPAPGDGPQPIAASERPAEEGQ